jgi:hypothetical protein
MKVIFRFPAVNKKQIIDALEIGAMQFFNWGLCTISWRAVAQANVLAAIITDTTLASLTFFVIKKMMKGKDEDTFIQWIGYTAGGVLGTVTGIYSSLFFLGK